ncbi:hypothetical protein GGR57DRAFT_453786 [Xylariaceae sp. FL1272]|nr:hypothetical protein GGR57DRAFT_453786 [Xylariaceae sp. FL1272]
MFLRPMILRTSRFAASTPRLTRPTLPTTNPILENRTMATSSMPDFTSHKVRNTQINEGSGVSLSSQQKLLVGSVLDLFEGNPTLKHLSLWSQNATFTDPLTVAEGYNKFAAQWYGLPALFNPIKIQSHQVTSGGNPIELNLKNMYTVKGIKKEQTIDSKVKIWVGVDGKIERLEDRWDGKLPEGAVSEAFRKLNAVTVPTFVKVPKTEEEDDKLRAERNNA